MPIDAPSMLGGWSIVRDLVDRSTDDRGVFVGKLVVFPDGHGFCWSESGTLTWRDSSRPAGRSLQLRTIDEQWWMTFVDGHPFYRWTFDTELLHPCGNDLYRGFVTATSNDEVQTTWDVTGPAKSQRIVSTLRRQAG